MMRIHHAQPKSTLRTSLSEGACARLAVLMLAQVLLVVAVIIHFGQHSWHAMWIVTLGCSGISDDSMQTTMLYQTVATVTHKAW